MLDDFTVVIQAKDIYPCPVSVFVSGPLLVTMQNHKVSFRECALETDSFARVLLCHLLEVRNEGVFAVRNMRIVLLVHGARVFFNRLSRLALVEHEVVKLFRRTLVSFESIIHGSILSVLHGAANVRHQRRKIARAARRRLETPGVTKLKRGSIRLFHSDANYYHVIVRLLTLRTFEVRSS